MVQFDSVLCCRLVWCRYIHAKHGNYVGIVCFAISSLAWYTHPQSDEYFGDVVGIELLLYAFCFTCFGRYPDGDEDECVVWRECVLLHTRCGSHSVLTVGGAKCFVFNTKIGWFLYVLDVIQ